MALIYTLSPPPSQEIRRDYSLTTAKTTTTAPSSTTTVHALTAITTPATTTFLSFINVFPHDSVGTTVVTVRLLFVSSCRCYQYFFLLLLLLLLPLFLLELVLSRFFPSLFLLLMSGSADLTTTYPSVMTSISASAVLVCLSVFCFQAL